MVEANSRGVVWGIGYDHTAWVYTGGYGGGCFQGEGGRTGSPSPAPSLPHGPVPPLIPGWLPCPTPEPLHQYRCSADSWLTGDLHHCQPPNPGASAQSVKAQRPGLAPSGPSWAPTAELEAVKVLERQPPGPVS